MSKIVKIAVDAMGGSNSPDKVIDGKNSPLETFTSCLAAFKLALSAVSFELFLKASDKVLTNLFVFPY